MRKVTVYRRTPSGFRISQLADAARKNSKAFIAVLIKLGLAAVLFVWGLWDGAPVPALLLMAAVALILSCLTFVRRSAQGAIEVPSIVLESVRKWDGKSRSTWTLRSDQMADDIAETVKSLSQSLGDPLVRAIADDGSEEETFVELALAEVDRPFIVAWTDSKSTDSVAVRSDVSGIWLRIDPQPNGVLGAVLVSDVGEYEQRMAASLRTPESE